MQPVGQRRELLRENRSQFATASTSLRVEGGSFSSCETAFARFAHAARAFSSKVAPPLSSSLTAFWRSVAPATGQYGCPPTPSRAGYRSVAAGQL